MKTNKHQTLKLVKQKRFVRARDLVSIFNYSAGTARSYLAHLGRQELLQRTEGGHALTSKGEDRLQFFEVSGCPDISCPQCHGKAGYYCCPMCGCKTPKDRARLKPIWDTVFFKRDAGVYCWICQCQILNEDQARFAGIQQGVKG